QSVVLDCPCEWWRPPECTCTLVPSENTTQAHPPSLQCHCRAPRCPCPAEQVACESPCMERCTVDCGKNPRGRDCPDVCSHTCRFACSHNVKNAGKLAITKTATKKLSCDAVCMPDCALSCTTLRPALSLMRLLVTAEGEGEVEQCKSRCNSSCMQLCSLSSLSSDEKCSSLCDSACVETCAISEVPTTTTTRKPSVKKDCSRECIDECTSKCEGTSGGAGKPQCASTCIQACAPLCPDSQDAKEQRKRARAPMRQRK
ncbi:hypothetical protein PMAYCL1PPCAC_06017, partial [Pristionchus mayeri]